METMLRFDGVQSLNKNECKNRLTDILLHHLFVFKPYYTGILQHITWLAIFCASVLHAYFCHYCVPDDNCTNLRTAKSKKNIVLKVILL